MWTECFSWFPWSSYFCQQGSLSICWSTSIPVPHLSLDWGPGDLRHRWGHMAPQVSNQSQKGSPQHFQCWWLYSVGRSRERWVLATYLNFSLLYGYGIYLKNNWFVYLFSFIWLPSLTSFFNKPNINMAQKWNYVWKVYSEMCCPILTLPISSLWVKILLVPSLSFLHCFLKNKQICTLPSFPPYFSKSTFCLRISVSSW